MGLREAFCCAAAKEEGAWMKTPIGRIVLASIGLLMLLPVWCHAQMSAPVNTVGWRGNWTGLYPEADPPVAWGRLQKGLVAGMTCQATKPTGPAKSGQPMDKGLIRDWLVIGPFAVADSVKDFDKEQIPGEAELRPNFGDKVGDLAWRRLEIKKQPDYIYWGTALLERVEIDKEFGRKPNRIIYALTYLHCERPGKVWFVVDHHYGFKLWVNGEALYSHPKNAAGLGSYVGISRQKRALVHNRSPKVELTLEKGWNRLLVKASTYNRKGWQGFGFAQRLVDIDPIPYDEKNIVWMTDLTHRSNASPIVVRDRLFAVADPDELFCIEKKTGKVLWRRLTGYYHATSPADRLASPVFREKLPPLVHELEASDDYDSELELRREIHKLLKSVDPKKYDPKWDGHFASHFGIIGFSTTPVSDGTHVYVFFGNGVAACYDLAGNRKWVRRIPAKELGYTCSPTLIGDKFVYYMAGKMTALSKSTGTVMWEQPEVKGSIASLIPATINGTQVVVSQSGQIVRAADGKVLWTAKQSASWTAPTAVDDVLYTWFHGVKGLAVADFSDAKGETWRPKLKVFGVDAVNRRPDGKWLDRPTCSSPLVHEGIVYGVDIYGVFYAIDVKTRKTLYRRELGFDELHHYNAVGVGASVALGGKHLYVMDNQGECVVIEPGRTFKEVARNRIETVLHRGWPVPTGEILTNASPVFDGRYLYLRGERYLYCIGEK